MVLQLVLLLLMISISIASINLGLNVSNKNEGAQTVFMVRKSLDRVNFTSNTRLILRNLVNIANGYEPNESRVLADRWGYYSGLLGSTISMLKDTQNILDNPPSYKYSQAMINLMNLEDLPIVSLDGKNQIRVQNYTLSQAQNLY